MQETTEENHDEGEVVVKLADETVDRLATRLAVALGDGTGVDGADEQLEERVSDLEARLEELTGSGSNPNSDEPDSVLDNYVSKREEGTWGGRRLPPAALGELVERDAMEMPAVEPEHLPEISAQGHSRKKKAAAVQAALATERNIVEEPEVNDMIVSVVPTSTKKNVRAIRSICLDRMLTMGDVWSDSGRKSDLLKKMVNGTHFPTEACVEGWLEGVLDEVQSNLEATAAADSVEDVISTLQARDRDGAVRAFRDYAAAVMDVQDSGLDLDGAVELGKWAMMAADWADEDAGVEEFPSRPEISSTAE
ncbi:hypothetical protein [Natronomonas amylolytica]|uniref:hypothetical protein n=1 Tax=Natronomonas amylolytica TaxID=3108498 RepID=UPI003008E08D